MKKSLLALAVLGAFAGVASAQSSVSLYGTVDLNARYVKADGSSRRLSLSQDGINSSQLGFKGTEDLGGGLKAGFVLLAGVNPDNGTANSKFWNRRSTVSLWGNFGEVRLGRDYLPTFWNETIFDAFGTNGLGGSNNIKQFFSAAASTQNYVRTDNTIGYFLPSGIGGVYGQLMAAAGEGSFPGRYVGGRVGFAAGPFDIAGAASQQTFDAAGNKHKTYNIGASYDLGVVKLLGYWDRDTYLQAKENLFSFSAVVPLGQGEIHVGAERSKLTNTGLDNKNTQFALGYVYNLSKRTALYTTVARSKSDNPGAFRTTSTIAGPNSLGGSSLAAFPDANGRTTGAEFGIRHFF